MLYGGENDAKKKIVGFCTQMYKEDELWRPTLCVIELNQLEGEIVS